MRRLSLMLLVVSLSGCADAPSEEPLGADRYWDMPLSAAWATKPTLVIAKRGGVYPDAPDVEIALACQPDGSVIVSGDAYRIATDVGGPLPTVSRFGLKSDAVTLYGIPVWSHNGYESQADFRLTPKGRQLDQLVSGKWFQILSIFEDRSGDRRLPAPPQSIAAEFVRRCGTLTSAAPATPQTPPPA